MYYKKPKKNQWNIKKISSVSLDLVEPKLGEFINEKK